jgi:glycosyltransferase involved in cell wall biosynthesis
VSSERTKISIVTPSLNQGEFIERTIRSVLDQEGDFDLEYLVFDGGSTDGTREVLERYGDRLRFVVEPDTGQANAVNKGLRAATGDVVGWVNSDDLLLPGTLARVAQAFREHPEALWLHGRCEIVDEEDRPIRRWLSAYKDFRCRRYSREALLVENFVSQMTVFWRRAAQAQVGVLDESLRYTFDYDLWLRLSALSAPLFLDEKLAAFRWYTRSKSGADFEKQFAEDLRVLERYGPHSARLRARKRLRTTQILIAYRLLRWVGQRSAKLQGERHA